MKNISRRFQKLDLALKIKNSEKTKFPKFLGMLCKSHYFTCIVINSPKTTKQLDAFSKSFS
jgi:hypothetical protein